MREDYELSKAARGLDEISKSAKGSPRSAKRVAARLLQAHPEAGHNIRVAEGRERRAAAVRRRKVVTDPVPDNLVLNTNPPKAIAAAPARAAISDRPAPGATRRRLVSSASRAVQAHPYRTAALTGGVLVPAGAGAAYGVSRKKG